MWEIEATEGFTSWFLGLTDRSNDRPLLRPSIVSKLQVQVSGGRPPTG